MALDATKVRIGITGELYKAPLGTALPTDIDTALNAAFVGLGYLSDDGATESNDDSVSDIVAWQNATTVRSATTESTLSLSMTLIENTAEVLETFHRGSVMAVAGGVATLAVKPVVADPSTWVLNVVDGLSVFRLAVGNGEIVERGDVIYQNGEPIGYPIVIRCYPDSNGNLMNKISNDDGWTGA